MSASKFEALRHQVNAFRNDATPSRWPSAGDGTGAFALILLAFAQIEALAGVAAGKIKAGASGCVHFIRQYFPSEYHSPADLLYWMYRHGSVHQFAPKLANVGGHSIVWMVTRGTDRRRHVRLIPGDLGFDERVTYLNVECDLLIEDTYRAGMELLERCESAPESSIATLAFKGLVLRSESARYSRENLSSWMSTESNWLGGQRRMPRP